MSTLSAIKHRVVIIGAGFVGLTVARQLAKTERHSADVLLIDSKDSFLFAPRLIDAIEQMDTSLPGLSANLADLSMHEGFAYVQGDATHIDRTKKVVHFRRGDRECVEPYDLLLVCSGSETNTHNTPGVQEYALSLKRLSDVERIHERIREGIKIAQAGEVNLRRRTLSFIVVGGGPSGIEAICAIKNYTEAHLRQHAPDLIPLCSYTLIQAPPQLLPGFSPKLAYAVLTELRRQGITVILGDKVDTITAETVTTASGQIIPSHLVLWTAGLKSNHIDITPEVARDAQGYLVTDYALRVDPSLFAAGDAINFRYQNRIVPKNAQTSLYMAGLVIKNLQRTLNEKPLLPYHYHTKGNLLVLGNVGFLETPFFAIRSRWIKFLRSLFYHVRFTQVVGSFTPNKKAKVL